MNNNLLIEPFGTFNLDKIKPNPFVKSVQKGNPVLVNLELEDNVYNFFKNAAKKHNWTVDVAINNYLKRALA